MNQKEDVLQQIADMNIDRLDIILSDDRTYNEANKEVFLQKLEEVFKQFKEAGNSKLIACSGVCGNEDCTNQGCKGYSFVGDVSNDCLGLIIEEENGVVTDIFHCLFMMPDNGSWELLKQKYYTVYTDEKAQFTPDVDYSIMMQRCEEALIDLKESYNNRLSIEDSLYWSEKYAELKEDTFSYLGYGGCINKFRNTHFEIERITNYIDKENEAAESFVDFNRIDQNNETELLTWLAKYETFGLEVEGFCYNNAFEYPENIKNGFIPLVENSEISVLVNDYKGLLNFVTAFKKHYWYYLDLYVPAKSDE